MIDHLAEGLAAEAIGIANIVIGVPLLLVARSSTGEAAGSDGRNRRKLLIRLFSLSIFLNAVWILRGFMPYRWLNIGFVAWISEPPTELVLMFIGFLLLCGSIAVEFVKPRSIGLGVRIGQILLLIISSLGWFVVFRDM
jgi:hypothetical protein